MATLIPQGGMFEGLDRLNQALDTRHQNALAMSQMQENKRRNALAEEYAAEDRNRQMQEIQRQELIRNAMSHPYTQQQGGPLMSQMGQDYQPVSLQTMQPTREMVAQRLMDNGAWEQALKLMPESQKPQIFGNETSGYSLYDPTEGVKNLVPGIPKEPKPDEWEPWGYGQQRNKRTKEIVNVPVAPTVANGMAPPKEEKKKPMPPTALRMQQDAVDAIATSQNIKTDMGAIRNLVESGQLNLGPVANLASKGLNMAGASTQNSRNFATFRASLEKLRNDSLRLNKGVQTDGDAQRAWNELMANINDEQVVIQRLGEIERINERGAELQAENLQNIRDNYGLDPLDTRKQNNPSPAVGKAQVRQQNLQNNIKKLSDTDLLKALGVK